MKDEKQTYLLTGATGFLGSHLMAALLERGNQLIVLGRSKINEPLNDRILKLLQWFGISHMQDRVKWLEADFLKKMCGVEKNIYLKLAGSVDHFIHCASDTSFSESKRERVMESNINSLAGILEFATQINVKCFNYISTAYVAGINEGICRENLSLAQYFTNVYEESKAQAENIISEYCTKHSMCYSIIRPSIVYGNLQNGRALKFNALYFPIRSLQNIRNVYVNDLENHSGKNSKKYGIFIDNQGYLNLPLKIHLAKRGAVNLIPVDYFVSASLMIIDNPQNGGIYHLTNNNTTKLETIATYNEYFMKVKGIDFIYNSPEICKLRNPVEELFERYMEPYRPYLSDNRIFDRKNTDTITGHYDPPEFSYEIFRKCMEFAMQVDWGESIFSKS